MSEELTNIINAIKNGSLIDFKELIIGSRFKFYSNYDDIMGESEQEILRNIICYDRKDILEFIYNINMKSDEFNKYDDDITFSHDACDDLVEYAIMENSFDVFRYLYEIYRDRYIIGWLLNFATNICDYNADNRIVMYLTHKIPYEEKTEYVPALVRSIIYNDRHDLFDLYMIMDLFEELNTLKLLYCAIENNYDNWFLKMIDEQHLPIDFIYKNSKEIHAKCNHKTHHKVMEIINDMLFEKNPMHALSIGRYFFSEEYPCFSLNMINIQQEQKRFNHTITFNCKPNKFFDITITYH